MVVTTTDILVILRQHASYLLIMLLWLCLMVHRRGTGAPQGRKRDGDRWSSGAQPAGRRRAWVRSAECGRSSLCHISSVGSRDSEILVLPCILQPQPAPLLFSSSPFTKPACPPDPWWNPVPDRRPK